MSYVFSFFLSLSKKKNMYNSLHKTSQGQKKDDPWYLQYISLVGGVIPLTINLIPIITFSTVQIKVPYRPVPCFSSRDLAQSQQDISFNMNGFWIGLGGRKKSGFGFNYLNRIGWLKEQFRQKSTPFLKHFPKSDLVSKCISKKENKFMVTSLPLSVMHVVAMI